MYFLSRHTNTSLCLIKLHRAINFLCFYRRSVVRRRITCSPSQANFTRQSQPVRNTRVSEHNIENRTQDLTATVTMSSESLCLKDKDSMSKSLGMDAESDTDQDLDGK